MKVFAWCVLGCIVFFIISSVSSDSLEDCVCVGSDLKFDDSDYAQAYIGFENGARIDTGFISCTNTNQDDTFQLQIFSLNTTCSDPNGSGYLMWCNEQDGSITARISGTGTMFVANAFCNDGSIGFNSCELSCTFCACPGTLSSGCFTSQEYSKTSFISNVCSSQFTYHKVDENPDWNIDVIDN